MKRHGNIYHKIISLENLILADKKARKGKKKQKDLIKFDKNKTENILSLHNELLNKTYTTSQYTRFVIFEPKRREISKLPYKDRIVHHAVIAHIGPILTKSFISQTYSCIKGRGIHKCLRDLRFALKKDRPKYCLKIDINKFYPSINCDILKILLRKKFKDRDLLWLLDDIIDSTNGIPLGNYTSQWFGNFYLNEFDHWIKEIKKIKHYFRYCDDMVILSDDKEYLHKLKNEIEEFLYSNLKLKLSNYQVFLIESRGIDFLGYRCFYDYTLLRDLIKKRFIKMLRTNPNKRSINSYMGWCKFANTNRLIDKLNKISPLEIKKFS